MAILKQNGVDGKIIRAQQTGKVMKQNYNFGKALIDTTTSIYINVNTVPISLVDKAFSIINWEKTGVVSGRFYGVMEDSSNYLDVNNNVGGDYLWRLFKLGKQTLLSAGSVGATNTQYYSAYRQDSLGSGVAINGSAIVSNTLIHDYNQLSQILIGRGALSIPSNSKGSYFSLYNRKISDVEINYAYGNGLGNEPFNSLGLLLLYKFDIAEILDFSAIQDGSDLRVGVRNYGSIANGHGEFIGLPAGTLTAQLDYANANHIGQW